MKTEVTTMNLTQATGVIRFVVHQDLDGQYMLSEIDGDGNVECLDWGESIDHLITQASEMIDGCIQSGIAVEDGVRVLSYKLKETVAT